MTRNTRAQNCLANEGLRGSPAEVSTNAVSVSPLDECVEFFETVASPLEAVLEVFKQSVVWARRLRQAVKTGDWGHKGLADALLAADGRDELDCATFERRELQPLSLGREVCPGISQTSE